MRTIILTGIVGTDAVQKLTQNGLEYISFRFVNNEPTDPKGADGKSKGWWVNVSSFIPFHKNLLQYLKKGKPLIVSGNLDENLYTSKVTGECEIGRTLRATEIQFLNSGMQKQDNTNSTEPKSAVETNTEMPIVSGVNPLPNKTKAVQAELDDSGEDNDDLPF